MSMERDEGKRRFQRVGAISKSRLMFFWLIPSSVSMPSIAKPAGL